MLRARLEAIGRDGDCLLGCVGRTPIARLERHAASCDAAPRAEIVAKLESRNPGGSLKDRTALGMLLDAEARGLLGPGARIVEATAGNTGIGLALVGRLRGWDVTLVMPERYGAEKARLCEALGATLVRIPGERTSMRECIEEARRLESEGAVFLNQFENPANPAIHELTTGPELWEQCHGRVDALVVGVGTGGTLTGVARAFRLRDPGIPVFAVEPQGSVIGGGPSGTTRVEGIGNQFVPRTLDMSLVSEVVTVPDDDAFATARCLASSEGILAGPSGGAIVHAAVTIARRLGLGRRVATILPDGADRYWSRGLFP